MSAAPPQMSLAIGPSKFSVEAEPLFQSIKPPAKTGIAKSAEWHMLNANVEAEEVNSWELCHQMMTTGLGVAGVGGVEFAEPDIEQRWIFGTESQNALAAAGSCDTPSQDPDLRPPITTGEGVFWFRDAAHSQLQQARDEVGQPANRVRIAHLDTGYDPEHSTRPQFLRTDLQKNFADDGHPNDATDTTVTGHLITSDTEPEQSEYLPVQP